MLMEQLETLRGMLMNYDQIPEERRKWWVEKCVDEVDRLLVTARVAADYLRRD